MSSLQQLQERMQALKQQQQQLRDVIAEEARQVYAAEHWYANTTTVVEEANDEAMHECICICYLLHPSMPTDHVHQLVKWLCPARYRSNGRITPLPQEVIQQLLQAYPPRTSDNLHALSRLTHYLELYIPAQLQEKLISWISSNKSCQ